MIVNRARLALETVAADWLTSPHNVDAATASTRRRVDASNAFAGVKRHTKGIVINVGGVRRRVGPSRVRHDAWIG
jgi:hypothetical protein